MKWGTPPQTFWPGIWQLLRDGLWAGTHLAILIPDGLSIPIVLVKIITSCEVIYSLWSMPWLPIHLGHDVIYVQIMMLHHDVILYLIVSMLESFFRTEADSGVISNHLQQCIPSILYSLVSHYTILLQYIYNNIYYLKLNLCCTQLCLL